MKRDTIVTLAYVTIALVSLFISNTYRDAQVDKSTAPVSVTAQASTTNGLVTTLYSTHNVSQYPNATYLQGDTITMQEVSSAAYDSGVKQSYDNVYTIQNVPDEETEMQHAAGHAIL